LKKGTAKIAEVALIGEVSGIEKLGSNLNAERYLHRSGYSYTKNLIKQAGFGAILLF
jgi:hypothetical protein